MTVPQPRRSALSYSYPWAIAGLGPLLLAQGLYVRRTVPRLPEPEGERSGSAGLGQPLRLLIVGDSAAAGVGVAHQNEALSGQLVAALAMDFRVSWRLVAQSGYTTPEIIARLHETEVEPFDVAAISIGVNDVTSRTSVSQWLTQKQELLELLTTRFGVQQVLCSTLPPMHRFPALPQPLRWYLGSRTFHFNDELVALLQGQAQCELIYTEVDGPTSLMASDGFHPAAPVYALWAERLAQAVRARWLNEKIRAPLAAITD